jgi:hypothetical protein
MGRWARCVPNAVIGSFLLLCVGCGGAGGNLQAPPPSPDFTLGLSPNSINIPQGGTSAPINISVTAQNGFAGSVQVALNGLPGGVAANPVSPFRVSAGSSVAVVFGADAKAPTGNFTVTAQGTSSGLNHSANLALAVQGGAAQNFPRTGYARTDAVANLDDSPGEPRHRHIAYDSANKNVFVANRAMNRVEVFSSTDQSRKAQISVAGATSADLSADGSSVWVGTAAGQMVAIDTGTLQVKARYPVSGLSPLPNTIFDRPIEVLALSGGKAMVRLWQPAVAEALLALWDPLADSWANLTSAAPQVFQKGVGVIARTGDHAKVLAAANDASGEIALFDANGNVVAGPRTLGGGTISLVAANGDGSRFALAFSSNGSNQVLLLDGGLNLMHSYALASASGVVFSRNGNLLYVAETQGSMHVITVLDGNDLHKIGQAPDIAIQGISSEIEEADETQLLFCVSNRGVAFLDAAAPGTLASPGPLFAAAPIAQPAEGPITGGTPAALAGQNFAASAQVKFGTQLASTASVSGTSEIQTLSPASVTNGAVNVAAYFPGGWLALAPDAFSYGPQIAEILPNAGTKSGGDIVQIYGYGFGSDAGKVSVTIAGQSATIKKVENILMIAASLGLGANYPFPLERITLVTPQGSPGKSDVVVTASGGAATSAKGFQYLQDVHVYSHPALDKFVLYDQKRQWVYLSNTDQVDVFDLKGQVFRGGIQPPGGPPPNAALRGMSLTPDSSQLMVADFGAQNLYVFNPDAGTGTSVSVGGVPGFLNSGPARVAATSAQSVFVGLSGEGGGSGACTNCLGQLDLMARPLVMQPAPQPEVTSLTGAPLVQGTGNGDRVFVAFGAAPGGPLAVWESSAPNHFTTALANVSATDLAAAADGTIFATRANGETQIRGADLSLGGLAASPELQRIFGRVAVPGIAVHPSGSLLYEPFLDGPPPASPPASGIHGGVDIIDALSGRLRLRVYLPEAFAMLATDADGLHGGFLAVDENGQRLFALTTSGLTVVQLADVPLGIGTVSPASGPAAGGTMLTIRGSGFQAGATIKIGGKAAGVTFKDMNTLSVVTPALLPGAQAMVISNPDGETTMLGAAFLVN